MGWMEKLCTTHKRLCGIVWDVPRVWKSAPRVDNKVLLCTGNKLLPCIETSVCSSSLNKIPVTFSWNRFQLWHRVVSSSNFLLLIKPPYPLSCTLNFRFQIRVLITLLVLLLFVNTTMAMPTFAQSELTVCALNANGLMSPVKLALIGPLLMKLAPHFFALSKTKTHINAVSNLQISNYEVFEEKAVLCAAPSTLVHHWLNHYPYFTSIPFPISTPFSHSRLFTTFCHCLPTHVV